MDSGGLALVQLRYRGVFTVPTNSGIPCVSVHRAVIEKILPGIAKARQRQGFPEKPNTEKQFADLCSAFFAHSTSSYVSITIRVKQKEVSHG